jgi:hypothetical protein
MEGEIGRDRGHWRRRTSAVCAFVVMAGGRGVLRKALGLGRECWMGGGREGVVSGGGEDGREGGGGLLGVGSVVAYVWV